MRMEEIKAFDTQRLQEMNVLVSESFGYRRPHHFLDDFPVWASPLSKVARLGAIDERARLIGHVGIRFGEMRTAKGSEKIALIGAVATAEGHRGKGVSSALMTEALKRIDARGCAWSLLWGSEHDYYARFGFNLQGEQARALVEKLSISKIVQVSEIKSGITETIFQSLLAEKGGLKLEEADRAWVFSHKTIQWLSLDSPFAFVGFERGMDMPHIVHAFGGDLERIQSLLYAIYTKDKIAEVLGTTKQLTQLGFSDQDLFREALCLARPSPAHDKKPAFPNDAWVNGISAC